MTLSDVVITGAGGFLGGRLAERLQRSSRLVLVDRKTGGDFSDAASMARAVRKNSVVVHLACTTIPATSELDPGRDIRENVIGTIKLLDACVKRGVKKFVFVSSGGTVYGNHGKKKITEEFPCVPLGAHGIMKLTIERYLEHYYRRYGLKYLIARPGNFYGREKNVRKDFGAVDVFFSKARRGEPIEIWGNGDTVRDYVHVDDAADFLARAVQSSAQGVFNVGTGRGMSLNDIIGLIPKRPRVTHQTSRGFDVASVILDSHKAKRILDWSPNMTVEHYAHQFFTPPF